MTAPGNITRTKRRIGQRIRRESEAYRNGTLVDRLVIKLHAFEATRNRVPDASELEGIAQDLLPKRFSDQQFWAVCRTAWRTAIGRGVRFPATNSRKKKGPPE